MVRLFFEKNAFRRFEPQKKYLAKAHITFSVTLLIATENSILPVDIRILPDFFYYIDKWFVRFIIRKIFSKIVSKIPGK